MTPDSMPGFEPVADHAASEVGYSLLLVQSFQSRITCSFSMWSGSDASGTITE